MTAWHDDSNARARVRSGAEQGCTDAELAAFIADEFDVPDDEADMWVGMHAADILRWRLRGRHDKRVLFGRLAGGDKELGRQWSRSNVAAHLEWGKQHLGYTGVGLDEEVRKRIEKAERERAKAAKGRGLRAV